MPLPPSQLELNRRSLIYRKIKKQGVRGMGHTHLLNCRDRPTKDRFEIVLHALISEGWVTEHVSYDGKGNAYDVTYVATGNGKGTPP